MLDCALVTPKFSHRSANGTNWYIRHHVNGRDVYVTWDALTPEERAAIVAEKLLGRPFATAFEVWYHTQIELLADQPRVTGVITNIP